MQRKLTILTIIILVLVSVNIYFLVTSARIDDTGPGPVFTTVEAAYVFPRVQANYLPLLDPSSGNVELSAKSAIVYDVKTGRELFQKDPEAKLPIASLTKIMTAIVVWETLSPNDVVTVPASAVKADGERQDLYAGENISVNSLLQLMLIESSNDAAHALTHYAKEKGIDLVGEMNLKAAELDMYSTKFMDPAGLDDSGYSTVSDLVKAVKYGLRYSVIWNFSRSQTAIVASTDGRISHQARSTNQLLGIVTDIFGGKTGYTDSALGCMILIVDVPPPAGGQEDKIISIVLGSRSRFDDISKLVQWTRMAYRWE